MKDMFMLQRIAVITLVFFSLFVMIDFVPDSVSSESNSSSSESCSTESCSPMEEYRNSILNSNGAQDVELPEDFGEDVQPDPKAGATHNKRTVTVKFSDKTTVTKQPSSDGSGMDITTESTDSGSVKANFNDKTVELRLEEKETKTPDGSSQEEKKVTVLIGIEF